MSDRKLPLHVDPLRLSKVGAQFAGQLAMAGMGRLLPLLASSPGEAGVELAFGMDLEQRAYLHLRVEAELLLVCQRCLGDVVFPVRSDRQLGVVLNELQAEKLPAHYEPLYVADMPLLLRDIVEDELILSLPVVARHASDECRMAIQNDEPDNRENERAADNPFAALARLKNS